MKFYTLLAIVLFGACTASQNMISKTGVKELKFGHGGGVVGTQTVYTLKADTRLFKNDSLLKKIDRQKTRELFEKSKSLADKKLDRPGNIYSFIQIELSEKTNRLVWQSGKKIDRKEIIELYKSLQLITKEN